ncbi:FAD-dependent oxidoreductase [Cumulibacter soli]|uniref:FAD-dependent oxidoreductase n=1 Tax=Cumulibacter soli TaxID=2546344 RepID=UPI001067A70A|nr:FAD-dependent oxidoreductase [Cumulibacter soli]
MNDLPVVIVGAGPAGLAAAAQLRSRGMDSVVLEAGQAAGASVRQWAHVRLFSPWSEIVDVEAEKLLATTGWSRPEPTSYPTGVEWAQMYLQPLADVLGEQVHYGSRVVGVARRGRDLVVDSGRESEPFVVHVATENGSERIEARAVIDASGTWSAPNPLGGDGLPAEGERAAAEHIIYRVPDLNDPAVRAVYAGKHIVVAGSGHSAMTALVALANLAEQHPSTRVSWLVRRASTGHAFGGGENDQLVARGALGRRAQEAVTAGHITTVTGFRTASVTSTDRGMTLVSFDGQQLDSVDEIVVVTGFRPDHSMLSEVRLDLDPVLQSPRQLAPLIDPNVHSCGSVYPHGAKELKQPEAGFYLVGMKSYGRAPSFLALTGYEQVRSVVAEIAGDHESAARVELTLPETGVCGGAGLFDEAETGDSGGCCGAPTQVEMLSIGAPAGGQSRA